MYWFISNLFVNRMCLIIFTFTIHFYGSAHNVHGTLPAVNKWCYFVPRNLFIIHPWRFCWKLFPLLASPSTYLQFLLLTFHLSFKVCSFVWLRIQTLYSALFCQLDFCFLDCTAYFCNSYFCTAFVLDLIFLPSTFNLL